MSKYTTEVRFICEYNAGLEESKGYDDVDNILTISAPKIFSFFYPIFNEDYRLILEKKILRHYYTREISEETVGLWKLRLEDKMNLIMPYYNKMYESELIKFNPLYDTDITTEHSGTAKGESAEIGKLTREGTTTEHRENTEWNLFSDTPQGGIEGVIGEGHTVDDKWYLTDARKITDVEDATVNTQSEDNNTVVGTTTNLNSFIEKVSGKRNAMSYSKMLQEFRDTFLRIDEMIIKELEPLFFGLW